MTSSSTYSAHCHVYFFFFMICFRFPARLAHAASQTSTAQMNEPKMTDIYRTYYRLSCTYHRYCTIASYHPARPWPIREPYATWQAFPNGAGASSPPDKGWQCSGDLAWKILCSREHDPEFSYVVRRFIITNNNNISDGLHI